MPRTKAGVEYKEAELDAAIVAVHTGMPVYLQVLLGK